MRPGKQISGVYVEEVHILGRCLEFGGEVPAVGQQQTAAQIQVQQPSHVLLCQIPLIRCVGHDQAVVNGVAQ